MEKDLVASAMERMVRVKISMRMMEEEEEEEEEVEFMNRPYRA